VRLDPKLGALPDACDELSARDLVVTVDGVAAKVTSVERVPRPERHWLVLDVSESTEGGRKDAMRSAREYLQKVMTPGLDFAAVLTTDDDTVLVSGPSSDPAALDASVAGIPPGTGSALRDGLATVLRQAAGDRHEHLVLFWTDGQDTESLTTDDELLTELGRAGNATVFPLVHLPSMGEHVRGGRIGSLVFDVAELSGGEVFAYDDPRWLDRVRGWIARRFTVAYVPPEGAGHGKLKVSVRGRRCAATILPDPFARPDALAGETPPAPPSWVRVHAKQRTNDDPACAAERNQAPWDWPLRREGDFLTGCVLDATAAVGPVLRDDGTGPYLDSVQAQFAARHMRVVTPPIAELPHNLLEAIPWLLSRSGQKEGERSPAIIEGGALLTQRARIAASLFAVRPDYHDFALSRLGRWTEVDLRAIERDFRQAFPALDAETIATIARESRAGRRLIGAARTPTDADLARVLTAWLGDLPASEFFGAWERRLVNDRLAGHGDAEAAKHWAELRARFGRPENMRVAAPLILIHDERRDLVGFWRIVLPRPMGYYERAMQLETSTERLEDRIPGRPLALDLLEDSMTRPYVLERLSGADYSATRIEYGPVDTEQEVPGEDPFRRARITLTLEAPGCPPLVLKKEETPKEETQKGGKRPARVP